MKKGAKGDLLMHHPIRENMTAEPVTITPDVSIADAREIMRAWGMRHLPVTDSSKLVGIISDGDIDRAFSVGKKASSKVADAMTRDPFYVTTRMSVGLVAEVMANNKYGCAVIVDDMERVQGIFTTTDALNILARILREPEEFDFAVLTIKDYLSSHQKAV